MIRFWIFTLVSLFLNTGLWAQSYSGIGKNHEILDIFARLQLKHSDTRTPADLNFLDGFAVRATFENLDSTSLSPKEKSDLDYLKKHYWSFFTDEYSPKGKIKIYRADQNFLNTK